MILDDKRKFPYLLIFPAAIFLLLLIIYPMLDLLKLVFFKPEFPFITFENISNLFKYFSLLNQSLISILHVTISTIGTVIFGLLISYLIYRITRFKTIYHIVFLLPLALPPIVAANTWKMALDPTRGIFNYILNLLGFSAISWFSSPKLALISVIAVAIWRWVPLAVLIFYAGFEQVPKSYLEAASVDGANEWQKFNNILLPLLKPFIIIVTFLEFIMCFREFAIIYGMTRGGPSQATETFVLRAYKEALQWGNFVPGAVISVIILVVGIVVTRYGYNLLVNYQKNI